MTARLCISLMSALAAVLFAGCDANVDAPLGREEPFSMYGVLNPMLKVQTVSVSPIRPLLFDYPPKLDVEVVSTDLLSGEQHQWRDSVVTGERGQTEHVFLAEFMPEFDRSYRIEAVRSDGAVTSAIARVPPKVRVDARSSDDGRLLLLVEGERTNLLSADVIYKMRIVPRQNPEPCVYGGFVHEVSYTDEVEATAGGNVIPVNLGLDRTNMVRLYVGNPGRYGLAMMGMSVRLLVGDEDWSPPGRTFYATTLAHPDVMTNTTNGFGLVTGGYEISRAAYPPADLVEGRFFDFVIRPPADCFDYCSCDQT